MGTGQSVTFDDLDQLVVRLELGTEASELHGSLCGFLSGGGHFGGQGVLPALHLEEGKAPTQSDLSLLSRLRQESEEALSDPEFAFQLLLPDDDVPVGDRADALVEWCRGFLGGLGQVPGIVGTSRSNAGGAEILQLEIEDCHLTISTPM